MPFARKETTRFSSVDPSFLGKQADGSLPERERLSHALLDLEAPDALLLPSDQ